MTAWLDTEVSRLRQLKRQGSSHSEIARLLNAEFGTGRTRLAVSAKLDRLDIGNAAPSAPGARRFSGGEP